MIRFEIHENGDVLTSFRNSFVDVKLENVDSMTTKEMMEMLGKLNNCQIVGTEYPSSISGESWWVTEAIEFPDEESLSTFLLRWL